MRIFATITAVFLFLFLLTSAPAFSQQADRPDQQDEHPQDNNVKGQDKDNAQKKDQKDQNAHPDQGKPDESRPESRQQDNNGKPGEARPQEQTQSQQQHTARPEEQGRENQARPEDRGRVDNEHAQPVEAGRGQRIPEDRFRTSFGREHHFHVDRTRIINQSQPEFAYSGYTFQLAQPWPAGWSYDDDCYVDYVDNNYYLYDVNHPGMRIVIFVIG
jgi:hypothetical protein